MNVIVKGKKLKVAEKVEDDDTSSDHIDDDDDLVISIEKLQEIQDQLEKLSEEASDEVLAVEQKYNAIRKPVYEKRNEIIKSIPDFWLTACLNTRTTSSVDIPVESDSDFSLVEVDRSPPRVERNRSAVDRHHDKTRAANVVPKDVDAAVDTSAQSNLLTDVL